MVLHLRRIGDSDSKFKKVSAKKQKHSISRDYKPSKVKNDFSNATNISKEQAIRPKTKTIFSTLCNLITQYCTMLPNIKTIFKKYLPVLHSNRQIF